MAITIAQTKTKNDFNTAGDMSLSFDSTPTVGNAVLVMVQGYFSSPTWPSGACTDNQGNTYTKAYAEDYQSGTGRWSALYYCLATSTSSGTFTVTMADGGTGNCYGTMAMLEVSGLAAFEGYATRDQTVSAATMTVTRNVATAAGLVLAQYGPQTGATTISVQALTQLTEQLSDSTAAAETDYLIASIPTGNYTVTWDVTPNLGGIACCAFFTEAAAVGQPTTKRLGGIIHASGASPLGYRRW